MLNIFSKSKQSIILIDNYIAKNILDILSKTEKQITIITKKVKKVDLLKYNEQYNNIKIIKSNIFHDRFIIIDDEKIYHCEASFKDLGNKCLVLNKIDSPEIMKQLLNKIKQL